MTARRTLITVLLVAFLGLSGTATAAEKKSEPQSSSPLPFELAIRGSDATSSVLVPVPEGSRPVSLTGTVVSTLENPGEVSVTIGARPGARVDALKGGVVDIPLTEEDVEQGSISVGMRASLESETDCFVGDEGTAALEDARLVYTYPDSTPVTIADFLSPGVTTYTVQTTEDPSTTERTAALDAVAALTHRFPAPTRVLVRTGELQRSSYLNRVIRLVEGTPPGGAANQVAVGRQGTMTVIGQGQDLADAAVALGDQATEALRSPLVTNLRAQPQWEIVDNQVSWRDLDIAGVNMTGVGQIERDVVVTQAMLGAGISDLKLRVRGGATAAPANGQGRIDMLWNCNLVSSTDMSDTETLDRTIDVSTADLERSNTLTVRLSFVPPGRNCQPPPIGAQLTIDPDISTMTPQAGQSEPPGFVRFPQILTPTVPVGFGAGTPSALLTQAADLIAALQSQTPHQLIPTSMTEAEFLQDGRPGVLVGASDDATRILEAPLQSNGGTWQGSGPDGFTASQEAPLAFLQAFSRSGRDMVILGAPSDEAEATRLAAYSAAPPDPWTKLPGQVVVLAPDTEPVALELTQPPETPSMTAPTIAAMVGISLLILLLGWWLWHRPPGPAPAPRGRE